MIEVLSLHYGTVFKHAFSHPHIFREFVRDVTGIDINPQMIHTEYEYAEPVGNVNIKYDIFAEDEKERVIVEIQHIKEGDFFDRFLYYHMIGIIEQVAKHNFYKPPKRVITIVVLASVPRDGSISFSWGRHQTDIVDEYNKRHQITPHELIFLNPRLVNEQTPESVRPWLELIKDSFDKQIDEDDYESSTFQQVIDIIHKAIKDSEVSTAMKDETAWEMASQRFHQEGREEGREEGHEKGRQDEKIEVIRKAFHGGVPIETIALLTDMEIDEIMAVKQQLELP